MSNSLQAILNNAARADRAPEPAPAVVAAPAAPPKQRAVAPTKPRTIKPAGKQSSDESEGFFRPSRDGRKFIGGHFVPEVGKQLRLISVEDETTVQALLEEALELLFVKKGRAKVAELIKGTRGGGA